MRLSTPRFGELEVKEDDIIVFPSGILGFDDVRRYVLLEHSDDSVFHILQGVDDPAVAFVLIDPRVFRPDYRAEISRDEVAELELEDEDEVVVRAIVTVPPGNPSDMTANLQAPIVLNASKGLGCQVVLADGPYSVRYPVLAELQAATGRQDDGDAGAEVDDTDTERHAG